MFRGKRGAGNAEVMHGRAAAPDSAIYGGNAFSHENVSPTSHLLGKQKHLIVVVLKRWTGSCAACTHGNSLSSLSCLQLILLPSGSSCSDWLVLYQR